ncbi:MAG TPA: anti-sigma factor [Blastocatellia bacterium]|nr:anti-sigma factor [Blastocatellia bacterium]
MKHDNIKEEDQAVAALYALGALSQHETHSFDSHLREGCAVCRSELDGFEQVTASLALGVFEASPSPYLRDVLTARIEREAQDPPEQASASGSVGSERWALTKPWEAGAPFWKAVLPWALAASFFVAFLMAFVAWRLDRRDLDGLIASGQRETSSALEDNLELREKLKRESALTDELNQINLVLASAYRRVLTLAGQEAAPSASAKVYWETKANRWVVSADLPPAPAGRVYQLWFVTADAKISAGLIDSDQNGHGFVTVRLPSNLTKLAAAAITLEPAGGSPQPTMPIYALGKA